MTSSIPDRSQILVIGGGPGGSYAATMLAREGFDVVLLEAVAFPRYHIGESMIPSCRFFLKLIDLDEKIMDHGFLIKPGAAFKLVPDREEGYTSFRTMGARLLAWNVVRSEFDEVLLQHAASSGARVFEQVTVTTVEFEGGDPSKRPIAATWTSTHRGVQGRITFDYLVDASGRSGLMSQKYLKNRRFNESLNNVASWGYWKGTGRYMPGSDRDNAPWFEALTDESGWCWFIPLHNGTTSVGIVEDQAISIEKKQNAKESNNGVSVPLKEHYLDRLQLCPGLLKLLGDAELVDDGLVPPVRAASDFSYAASSYGGDHFRLVGDAAAFIDPFFSSGIHLAFTDALSAAISISSSIRREVAEKDCAAFHDARVSLAYTRFLIVVLSAYSQIRAQNAAVLSDINESDFARAFEIILPVIQGLADTGDHVTQGEVVEAMDFCKPILGLQDVHTGEGPPPAGLAEKGRKFGAWVRTLSDFSGDIINGFAVNLERGHIGLVHQT